MNDRPISPAQRGPKAYTVSLHDGVKHFLKKLPDDEKARSERQIDLLEDLGPKLSEPHAGPLGKGLWELKFRFNKKWFRYLYTHEKSGHYIIVHGFTKKENQTPEHEKDLARKRIRELGL